MSTHMQTHKQFINAAVWHTCSNNSVRGKSYTFNSTIYSIGKNYIVAVLPIPCNCIFIQKVKLLYLEMFNLKFKSHIATAVILKNEKKVSITA